MIEFGLIEKILICCMEVVMLNSFSRTLLKSRKRCEGGHFTLLMEACTIAVLTMINNFDNPMVNLICVPVMYCIYTVVVYPTSFFKCISSSICFYMLAMAPEFMVAILFSLSNFHDAEGALGNELSGLCLAMIAKIITFIMAKCIEQIHKKSQYEKASNSTFCYLLILPGATMVLLVGLFCADLHISEKNKIFLEVGTFMLLSANAFMFYLFDKLIENMEKANKAERLYMKSRTENKHYQQIEQINEKHIGLLHDIKKYLRTAAELIQDGDKEHALQIFEKLDVEMQNTSLTFFCENKILNAILRERQAKAAELEIKYDVDMSPDLYIDYIEDIDLISIAGNLIDNAIEAARLAEGGYVRIRMFMANEGYFMVWEVSNNFLIPPLKEKGGFITSKRNKEEHGIGIHTVEKIVKSYDGNLKIDTDDKEFRASILFQIRKEDL